MPDTALCVLYKWHYSFYIFYLLRKVIISKFWHELLGVQTVKNSVLRVQMTRWTHRRLSPCSSSIVCKYENGTICLSIQETIPSRTIFNYVAHIMKGIILKSEGHSENQILNLTVLPLWNKDYHYHYYYCYYYYYYYHYYYHYYYYYYYYYYYHYYYYHYHYYHYYCYYYYYYYYYYYHHYYYYHYYYYHYESAWRLCNYVSH